MGYRDKNVIPIGEPKGLSIGPDAVVNL